MDNISLPSYKQGKSGRRYKYTWTISDSYDYYKKANKDLAIEKSKYVGILTDFFWEISKVIIRNRYDFKMPYRLGFVKIRKNKLSSLNKHKIDYKYYNETGKKKYHLNIHTDRYYFYWSWDKRRYNYTFFVNSFYYKFIPNRGNDGVVGKRGLSKWIKSCSSDPTLKDYDVI